MLGPLDPWGNPYESHPATSPVVGSDLLDSISPEKMKVLTDFVDKIRNELKNGHRKSGDFISLPSLETFIDEELEFFVDFALRQEFDILTHTPSWMECADDHIDKTKLDYLSGRNAFKVR